MKPLLQMPAAHAAGIDVLFTDIDDTVTTDGRLTASAYAALESLQASGIHVVPVTGRPAGWCDHIARMWPVALVVGENGAFYFRHDAARRRMQQRFFLDEQTREENRRRLDLLAARILDAVPGSALASDQAYRVADVAVDWCEDVGPLSGADVARIVQLFEDAGAHAKVSSIHVNGWFGDYDKLSMARIAARECLGLDLDAQQARCAFVGDSPNDAPMFGFFRNAIGVANVTRFAAELESAPAYVTAAPSGAGLEEVGRFLEAARRASG